MDPLSNQNAAPRIAALARYNIMDTPAEVEFDDVVRLVSLICDAPIATVTLLDSRRQWFKAKLGLDVSETPIDQAFCRHAITQTEPMIVPDASQDPRFADNPLVTGAPHIRFYAGAPLIGSDGIAIGTLCTIDRKPRPNLTPQQHLALKVLSQHIMTLLELRRTFSDLKQKIAENELSLKRIENLEELVPVCPQCRRVRNDGGFWIHAETYVVEHPELRSSHSICPDCQPGSANN